MACNTLASEELENTINEIDNLLLDEITEESTYKAIKFSKDKDAILHNGYYYNWQRENQNGSIVFKCRQKQEELKKKVSWCFYLEYQWNFYCKIKQVCTTSADSM